MTPIFTATERKEASRQALALLTASLCEDPDGSLIRGLIGAQDMDLPCWLCRKPMHEHCSAHVPMGCPGYCDCKRRAA